MPIVRKVNTDLRIALDDPEVKSQACSERRLRAHMTPEEVTAFVQNEQKTWRPILEQVAKEAEKK